MFLMAKKIVGAGAAILLVATLFYSGALENSFVSRPRLPDPEYGRIVPYEAKGVLVYITKDEKLQLLWLDRIMYASAGVIIFIFLLHGGDALKSKGWQWRKSQVDKAKP